MAPVTAAQNHQEIVTLKEYVDARLMAIDKATEVAYTMMDARLDSMNEIRNSLRDQGRTFVSKAEYTVAHDRLMDDVRSLRESRALLEGKASTESVNKVGTTALTGIAIGVFGLIISVISLLLRLMGL
jgi:hypothetical protein